ncbi:hypothetical protein DEJ46_06570 [Streptomyces venezuelae]|uniref:Uncharacterized protein n=1 Tax=Streptomyces venezuelae TaxID=54571 RepID=A0A5P2AML8_STRVZ|nr:hypothetical protein DEJ46_06570 [Streptomyces venezuelae]
MESLRRWAGFEPVDLARLPTITAEAYDGATVARLTTHITAALNTRLQAWADMLVRAVDAATDEFSAGRELAQARTGLRSIRDLADHHGLPERLRERLTELVDRQIPELQAQLERLLEEAAREEPEARWIEERRRTLRDNALTAVLAEPPATAPHPGGADAWSYDPAAAPRRRVLRD